MTTASERPIRIHPRTRSVHERVNFAAVALAGIGNALPRGRAAARHGASTLLLATLLILSGSAVSPVHAQSSACIQPVQTRLIEFDIKPQAGVRADAIVGALTVDDRSSSRQSKLWFITRSGSTNLYRLDPGRGIKKDPAKATAWDLGSQQTGGLRLRHSDDGRFAFVHANNVTFKDVQTTFAGLVAVDTQDNTRITWPDHPAQDEAGNPRQMSDVSIDTRDGGQNVFTAAPFFQDFQTGQIDGSNGVVQRLRPGNPQRDQFGNLFVPAQVTRWLVGGGAGTCEEETTPSDAAPCIPGIAADRRRGHPIFFSEPQLNAIGELDTRTNTVRDWVLPAPLEGPRQILVDDSGRVWGITTSGHLFSLVIDRSGNKATFTRHDPLGPGVEYLFAVAPDGGITGFTDSNNNEVSVLFPQKNATTVFATPRTVTRVTRTINGDRVAVAAVAQDVAPRVATAPGITYTNPDDGTYVETDVSMAVTDSGSSGSTVASLSPTGMSPDGVRRTGSFFYGVVTGEENRVGHFEVPVEPEKELDERKDDDDFDDDGDDDQFDADDDDDGVNDDVDDDDDNDCVPDMTDNDRDNDGVENEYDTPTYRENKRLDRGVMAPGQSVYYEMTADPNTLLMLAVVEAVELTTPLSIEFVDPNGVVVLSTPPALGTAVATATPALVGVYTVRVKNSGLTPATYKTTLVGKRIWF